MRIRNIHKKDMAFGGILLKVGDVAEVKIDPELVDTLVAMKRIEVVKEVKAPIEKPIKTKGGKINGNTLVRTNGKM